MGRIIVISEDWVDDDLFRNVVAEVNEDDGSRQYSRTPFAFPPDTPQETVDELIVAELRPYLTRDDEAVITSA